MLGEKGVRSCDGRGKVLGRQRSIWRENFDGSVLPEHFDKDKTFLPYLINKGTFNSTTIVSASAGWKNFKEAFTRDCYYKSS
jgi:hypothetical protein